MGRCSRRDGLDSSHLTAWRKGGHDGMILGLAPKKRKQPKPGLTLSRSASITLRPRWPSSRRSSRRPRRP